MRTADSFERTARAFCHALGGATILGLASLDVALAQAADASTEGPLKFAADWSEFATAAATTVGLLLTILSIRQASNRASRERKAALEQAKRELKWSRTVEAQAAIRRLLDDKRAFDAMTMLDPTFAAGETENSISEKDIVEALKARESFTKTQLSIRSAMDSLFTHFELIEQAIDADIFKLEDIRFPIEYYIRRMYNIGKETFASYMKESDFRKAITLINEILKPPKKMPILATARDGP